MKLTNEFKKSIKENFVKGVSNIIVVGVFTISGAIFGAIITNLPRFVTLDSRVTALESQHKNIESIQEDVNELKSQTERLNEKLDSLDNKETQDFEKLDKKLDDLKNILIQL